LLSRLVDPANQVSLQAAVQDEIFSAHVKVILDLMRVPAHHNMVARVYLTTQQQRERESFENYYNNNMQFRRIIVILLAVVEFDGGGPFFPTVTPDVSPQRAGGGENPGNGDGGAGAAPMV
jgi:hypothetical protein